MSQADITQGAGRGATIGVPRPRIRRVQFGARDLTLRRARHCEAATGHDLQCRRSLIKGEY
jgi:hypothetical protein